MSELHTAPDDCVKCSRLADFRSTFQPKGGRSRADYYNAPVAGFGDLKAKILIVGLAPGLHGAHRTGRPFTGDGAGDFMYPLLHKVGYATKAVSVSRDDDFELKNIFITNAVKCVPPENKPTSAEYTECRPYLEQDMATLGEVELLLALGRGAFQSCLALFRAQGLITKLSDYPFSHGAVHQIGTYKLVASYHTSRYNIQTRRLTEEMFLELLEKLSTLVTR